MLGGRGRMALVGCRVPGAGCLMPRGRGVPGADRAADFALSLGRSFARGADGTAQSSGPASKLRPSVKVFAGAEDPVGGTGLDDATVVHDGDRV